MRGVKYVCLAALATACSKDPPAAPGGPAPEDMPRTVDVRGAEVVAGLAKGRLRQPIAVGGIPYRQIPDRGPLYTRLCRWPAGPATPR